MKNSTQAVFNTARVPKQHENHLSCVKNAVRKAASLFVFAAFIAFAATPALASGLVKITEIQGGGGASKNIGTDTDPIWVVQSEDRTIYFGNYWQTYNSGDNTKKESYKKEGIRWRVLSNDQTGTGTKRVLLLADKGLYADKFNDNYDDGNKWVSSDIRETLTGLGKKVESTAKTYEDLSTNSFAHDAFNAKEYAAIADTTHMAGGNAPYNHESTDRLFLLSDEEVMNADYGLGDTKSNRIVAPTDLARSVDMYGNNSTVAVSSSAAWWLRTPGSSVSYAYEIKDNGTVDGTSDAYSDNVAARAAFNLNQESVLFLSAAVDGKKSVAVGDGFVLQNYDGSQGWKVTLIDTGIAKPTDVIVTQPTDGKGVDNIAEITPEGRTIDLTKGVSEDLGAPVVAYTAEAIKDGKANYISAILKNGDNYINYAKISVAAHETDKKVGFDDLADGTYKMFIFAEKENGDKQTDYASEFSNTEGYEFTKGTQKTVYVGKLGKVYRSNDLTIELGGGFNLSFENAEYVTQIKVVDGDIATITGYTSDAEPAGFLAAIDTVWGTEIASDTDGTTLKGKVTVEEAAQVTCCGKTTFKDLEVNGKLTVEDGAVVELLGIQIVGEGAIYMDENATLVNNSGKDVTVKYISDDGSTEEVTIKDGYEYKPSEGEPKPSQENPSKGGSSVGCNAGFGIAMLLSAAAAMLCKRRRG